MKNRFIENYLYSFIDYEQIFDGIHDLHQLSAAKDYLRNAISDAEYGFNNIKKHINKNQQILEVGGGLHLLSGYLKQEGYQITSIEPGNFTSFTKKIRGNILNKSNFKEVYTGYLEEFDAERKYDFIFSINVLEHTESVIEHLKITKKYLQDNQSKAVIRCPNYNFPFEPHFYSFFIPNFPDFSFNKILRKRLEKKLGYKKYKEILNSLNFDCRYSTINKNFNITFNNPFTEILERLKYDESFKARILENNLLNVFYQFIKYFNFIKVFKLFPKRYYPYLVFEVRK